MSTSTPVDFDDDKCVVLIAAPGGWGRRAEGGPVRSASTRVPVEIWILVAAAFLIALGYGLVAPILPQFAQSFDVGVMAASAIVSIFAFVRLVFAPAMCTQ